MSDDDTATPPTETPPTPPTADPLPPEFDMGGAFDSHSDNIGVFAEMSASSYLMRASLLAIRFLGRGDANKARRDFMRVAMETFDTVSSEYGERCFRAAMLANAQRRRAGRIAERAAARNAETPPPGEPTPPDGNVT